jgi:hypothetical protein
MTATRIALAGWLLVVALYLVTLALTVGQPWFELTEWLWLTVAFAFALIGGLICVRRPGNRIGAVFLVFGGVMVLQAFCRAYAASAWFGEALPGGDLATWLSIWVEVPAIVALLIFLPLLFPTGRLLSPRWRLVAWLAIGLAVAASVALAVDPEPIVDMPFDNPFAVPALGPFSAFMRDTGFVFVPILALAAVASLILRVRRSTGVERQQMKWFGYSFALAAVYMLVVWGLFGAVLGVTNFHPVINLVGVGLFLAIPASVAIAVLRYRLYDIDRLISRTVSYAALTLVLVGIYVAGVLGLGSLVRALTGGGGGDLVVAASTLAVAAAFGPVRHRVQALVDRRFNRARYDAQRTVEAFAQRQRDEIDLGALAGQLR